MGLDVGYNYHCATDLKEVSSNHSILKVSVNAMYMVVYTMALIDKIFIFMLTSKSIPRV